MWKKAKEIFLLKSVIGNCSRFVIERPIHVITGYNNIKSISLTQSPIRSLLSTDWTTISYYKHLFISAFIFYSWFNDMKWESNHGYLMLFSARVSSCMFGFCCYQQSRTTVLFLSSKWLFKKLKWLWYCFHITSGYRATLPCLGKCSYMRLLLKSKESERNKTSVLLNVVVVIVWNLSLAAYNSPQCNAYCSTAISAGPVVYLRH